MNQIEVFIFIIIVITFAYYWLRSLKLNISNKVVFITGCDTGFGYNLARHLCEQGYYVFAGCLYPESASAKQLFTFSNIKVVKCDVTSQKSVECVVKHINSHLSDNPQNQLWALVNNAGVAVFGDLELVPFEEFQRVLRVNVEGTVRVTRAVLPLLRQSCGRVVTIASAAGLVHSPGFTAYSCSKSALVTLTNCLRLELHRFGMLAISIEPGFFRTPIAQSRQYIDANKQYLEQSPELTRNAYENDMKGYLGTIKKSDILSSDRIDRVLSTLEHAISAKYPCRHYIIPWYVDILITLSTRVPYWFTDMITFMTLPFYKKRIPNNSNNCSKNTFLL